MEYTKKLRLFGRQLSRLLSHRWLYCIIDQKTGYVRGAKGLGRHRLTFHTRLLDRFSLSDQGPGTPALQKPFSES